jgi:DNA-directed RNA polymerase subunit E'/Rpb7
MFSLTTFTHKARVTRAYTLAAAKDAIRDSLERKSHKKYGFCISVEDIVILEQVASITGSLICTAIIVAQVFMPVEGESVQVHIDQYVKDKGIFGSIKDLPELHVFIPICGAFELEPDTSVLSAIVSKIRFQNGNYRILGSLENK